MERDKLIELLENGSEAELTLVQNYILDRVIKNMPTENEVIQRCIENSKKVKELEDEVIRLRLLVDALRYQNENLKNYSTGTTPWGDSVVTCSGFQQANSANTANQSAVATTWTATTI